MKETGKGINPMARGLKFFAMVVDIKESGKMTKNTEKEFLPILKMLNLNKSGSRENS